MKRTIIYGVIAMAGIVATQDAAAQKFAIKAYDNIGLGKAMSITEGQPGQKTKSSANSFGIDFGYRFWERDNMFLEANIGVGYGFTSGNFSIDDMSYHYNAPAIADEDGNEYIRYYELSNLKQKATLGYVNIPIYLSYQYRPVKWLGIYAEAGFNCGIRTFSSIGKVSGKAKAWGVFPEYDDLLIDQDYLDDFGVRDLSSAKKDDVKVKGFNGSVMCGAGLEFYTYEPVSFVVGVRYNQGLTQVFNGAYDVVSTGEYTAETAPVYYTVKDGTQVRSLADYTTKSRLSPLSLHVGINIRF